jgi:hypothetical protein
MMLEWIFHTLVLYAGLAVGMGLCLYLFFTVKIEMRSDYTARRTQEALCTEQFARMRESLEQLQSALHESEERTGVLVPPTPPRSGLNLNRRSQALKMYRRGDPPEQIASALGLALTEVELLVKVHQIVLEQVS